MSTDFQNPVLQRGEQSKAQSQVQQEHPQAEQAQQGETQVTKFYPLPFDFERCQGQAGHPDCSNCRRYADHPQQTWGPRTPMAFHKPQQSGCDYRKNQEVK